ncbi:hypothetical protein [Brachybacterium subflavum]|uniref:hypothetical protein n=1 Tax=Brachybacterium subflavum TaxID=2585206 RepID=UPI00126641FA|nr:hypothetical protein [Brachybacterium subflavum]
MPETKTAAEQARAAGAKTPADRKKAASAKVKALQAEAADGDVVVELEGETYTVHLKEFQERSTQDYEFMEMATKGIIPVLFDVLLDSSDVDKLKDSARDEETGRVSFDKMTESFNALLEAAGAGN